MICVPVFEQTTEAAVEAMAEAAEQADIIELRLDAMASPDIEALLAARPQKPVIVTARRLDEGGAYSFPDQQRIDLLARAAELGADYIDIELRTLAKFRQQLLERKASASLIVSWHSFMDTPDHTTLRRQVHQAFEAGADVCKLIPYARAIEDNGRLLEVVAETARSGQRIIGFCMGELGRFSRVATLFMGGLLTFASLRQSRAVAPGMPSLEELKRYLTEFHFRPAGCAGCQLAPPAQ
jgi:3-dehydroquinate dehydratase type I